MGMGYQTLQTLTDISRVELNVPKKTTVSENHQKLIMVFLKVHY